MGKPKAVNLMSLLHDMMIRKMKGCYEILPACLKLSGVTASVMPSHGKTRGVQAMLVTLGSLKYIFETEFNYIGKVSTLTRELYLLVPIRLPLKQSFLNKIEDICCTVECGVEWSGVSLWCLPTEL